jgi:hypothetical protein
MLVAIVVAYVATLPLLHPILAALGFKRIVLADAVFAALFLTAAAGRRRWLRPPSVRLCAAAAGPLLAIAASAALAGAQPFPDLARVAYSMAVLLLFAHLRLSKQDIDRVSWTWLVTAVAISLAGVVAFVGVTMFGTRENFLAGASSPNLGPAIVRLESTMGANALALFLQPSLAVCLYLTRGRPVAGRWLRPALALLLATAALTFSRGIVGVSLVLALSVRPRGDGSRRRRPCFWPRRRPPRFGPFSHCRTAE